MVATLTSEKINSSLYEEDRRRVPPSHSQQFSSSTGPSSPFKTTSTIRDLSFSTLSNVDNFNYQFQKYEKSHLPSSSLSASSTFSAFKYIEHSHDKSSSELPRIEEHIEIITEKFSPNFGQTQLKHSAQNSKEFFSQLRQIYHLTPQEYYQKNFDSKNLNQTEKFYNREAFYNSASYSASFVQTIQSKSPPRGVSGPLGQSTPQKTLASSSEGVTSPLKSSFSPSASSSDSTFGSTTITSSLHAPSDDFSSDYFDKAPDQPIYFRTIRPFEENKRKLKKSLNTLKSLTKYNNISYIKSKGTKHEEKEHESAEVLQGEEKGKSLPLPASPLPVSPLRASPLPTSPLPSSSSPLPTSSSVSSTIRPLSSGKTSSSPAYYLTDPIPSNLSPVALSKKTTLPSTLSPVPPKHSPKSSHEKGEEFEPDTNEPTAEQIQRVKNSYEELGMSFNETNYLKYQKYINHSPSRLSSSMKPLSTAEGPSLHSPTNAGNLIPSLSKPLRTDTFFSSPYKLIPTENKSVNMNIVESSSRPTTPGYIILNNSASLPSSALSSRPNTRSSPITSRPSSSSGFQTLHLPQASLKVGLDGVPILTSNYSTDIDKLNELNIAKNYGEDSFLNLFPSSEVPIVAQSQQTVPFSHLETIIKKATRNGLNGKIVDDVGGWGGIGTLIDEEIEAKRKQKQWTQKLREKKRPDPPGGSDLSLLDHTGGSDFYLATNMTADDTDLYADRFQASTLENYPILEDDDCESQPTIYHSENGDSEVWSNPSFSHSTSLSPAISPRNSLTPLPNRIFSPSISACLSPINVSPRSSYRKKLHNDISNSSYLMSQEGLEDPPIKESELETEDRPLDETKDLLSETVNEENESGKLLSVDKEEDPAVPKLELFRSLKDEFESLKDKEGKDEFDFEDEDEVPVENDPMEAFFQYEKDFKLFPTPSNVSSHSARPYNSANIFQETYQFNTDHLKEVLQNPSVTSTVSLFKSDVTHPVLIQTGQQGLELQLHSQLPKNRPLSAREKIETNEFKVKDTEGHLSNKFESSSPKGKSLASPIAHTRSDGNFFSSPSLTLTELNPLTSTSYSTLYSNLLFKCDDRLRKYQTLKNITPEEEEMQFNVLMQLYRLTNGKKWKRKTNWGNRSVSLNLWYGISINPQGHIVSIELKENNLVGPFPDCLSSLSFLETIFLDSNQLEGELPDYLINQCPHLMSLSLTKNNLYGIIPFNLINKKNKLRELWLSHNNFYGIIQDGIGDLQSLTHLDLSSNKLDGIIPLTFGKLHQLIYLNLSANGLTGVIPSSVASLSNLKYLYLNNNNLSGKVPFWILKKKSHDGGTENDYALSNLNKIEIFGNPLLEIDDDYDI